MDHHCHWVANFVGYYNQKNFYQFLFYSTFGDIVGFLLLIHSFINCNKDIKRNVPSNVKINSAFELVYYMWTPIQLLISSLCALAMVLGIGTLFYKQTKMLLNNQTTIDKKLFDTYISRFKESLENDLNTDIELLTGDNHKAANYFASKIGINNIH